MASFTSNFVVNMVVSVVVAGCTSAATISTGAFGYWNKDRELDISMVNISLSILQGENKEESVYGRKFALRALSQYSGVDIPADELNKWAAVGIIPEFDIGSVLSQRAKMEQRSESLEAWARQIEAINKLSSGLKKEVEQNE